MSTTDAPWLSLLRTMAEKMAAARSKYLRALEDVERKELFRRAGYSTFDAFLRGVGLDAEEYARFKAGSIPR